MPDAHTNRQMLELSAALHQLDDVTATVAFNYAAARNRQTLAPLVASLREASKPPGKADEYREAMEALALKHAVTRPDGSPEVNAVGMVRVKDPAAYVRESEALAARYPEAAKLLADTERQYQQLLNSPAVGLSLARCPLDAVPNLPGAIFAALMPMFDVPDDVAPPASPPTVPLPLPSTTRR